MNAAQLLPAIRDLYSRHPEMYDLETWELQLALFVLGYTDDLADEGEIAAAVEVARGDYPQWREDVLLATASLPTMVSTTRVKGA